MKHKTVFVSYSSRDRQVVNQIVKELKEIGIYCWKAPEMIPAGSSYASEIPHAIRDCEVFLLMLSETSQSSIWVEKEIDSAISNRKNIIPLQLDDEPLNDVFQFYLNNIQMIRYCDDPAMAMEDLKSELSHFVLEAPYERQEVGAQKTVSGKDARISSGKQESASVSRHSGVRRDRTNALRSNRIPVECEYCGCNKLENTTLGTYRCVKCGRDNYDEFQTIRNYLDHAGSASALEIERNTGISRRTINHFFNEEYLEISGDSSIRVPCSVCGAPIRTGTMCEECKKRQETTGTLTSRKETWHSYRQSKF